MEEIAEWPCHKQQLNEPYNRSWCSKWWDFWPAYRINMSLNQACWADHTRVSHLRDHQCIIPLNFAPSSQTSNTAFYEQQMTFAVGVLSTPRHDTEYGDLSPSTLLYLAISSQTDLSSLKLRWNHPWAARLPHSTQSLCTLKHYSINNGSIIGGLGDRIVQRLF